MGALLAVATAMVIAYPLVETIAVTVMALAFASRREGPDAAAFYEIADVDLPFVSVVVATDEDHPVIDRTLNPLHVLHYPRYEVVVVDDHSRDDTVAATRQHTGDDARFRVVAKQQREGLAMALNDALPLLRGEVVVLVRPGYMLSPESLRYMAAHFARLPRVGAVTGTTRVSSLWSIGGDLVALDRACTVAMRRRAEVVLGRGFDPDDGVVAMRKTAIEDVGGFDHRAPLPEADLLARLQRRHYDVRFEPRAVADLVARMGMADLWSLLRARAVTHSHLLQNHSGVLRSTPDRRQWPAYAAAWAAVVWAHLAAAVGAVSVASMAAGARPAILTQGWLTVLVVVGMTRVAVAISLGGGIDREMSRAALLAPLHLAVTWMLWPLALVRSAIPTFAARQAATPGPRLATT